MTKLASWLIRTTARNQAGRENLSGY
jgi:hypothetical protein